MSARASRTHRWDLVLEDPGLGRSGLHAGQVQGVAELPDRVPAVVAHQVHLAEARAVLVPLGEGPDGDLSLQHRPGLGARSPLDLQASPVRGEHAVDRGRGDRQELRSDLRGYLELAAALQGFHDLGHEWGQALPRGPVEYRPHEAEGGEDLRAVDPLLGRLGRSILPLGGRRQGPAGVPAGPPRQGAQLVEDPALVDLRSLLVALEHLLGDRLAFCHRKAHRTPPPAGLVGPSGGWRFEDISDEARGGPSRTFPVMQLDGLLLRVISERLLAPLNSGCRPFRLVGGRRHVFKLD